MRMGGKKGEVSGMEGERKGEKREIESGRERAREREHVLLCKAICCVNVMLLKYAKIDLQVVSE
jgi:hypothetical protein